MGSLNELSRAALKALSVIAYISALPAGSE